MEYQPGPSAGAGRYSIYLEYRPGPHSIYTYGLPTRPVSWGRHSIYIWNSDLACLQELPLHIDGVPTRPVSRGHHSQVPNTLHIWSTGPTCLWCRRSILMEYRPDPSLVAGTPYMWRTAQLHIFGLLTRPVS